MDNFPYKQDLNSWLLLVFPTLFSWLYSGFFFFCLLILDHMTTFLKVAVSVCVCVCVRARAHMYLYIWVEKPEVNTGCILFLIFLQKKNSLSLTQSPLIVYTGWLASWSQGSYSLCLSALGWFLWFRFLCGCWGSELESVFLFSDHFPHWAIPLIPSKRCSVCAPSTPNNHDSWDLTGLFSTNYLSLFREQSLCHQKEHFTGLLTLSAQLILGYMIT